MKLGLTNAEAAILKKIADRVDLRVNINEKNIVDIPNAAMLLEEAYGTLRSIPKFVAKRFVNENKRWFNLLGLK